MSVVNNTAFFKSKFKITKTSDDVDLLQEIINTIRIWQTRKWNKPPHTDTIDYRKGTWRALEKGGRIFSKEGSKPVYIEAEAFTPDDSPEQKYWACTISERSTKERGYCERVWTTEIGYEQNSSESAILSCVVSYGDIPDFIGLYEKVPDPTLPGFVRMVITNQKFTCTRGSDPISLKPEEILVGDYYKFMALLENPKREIPYIYISPRKIHPDSDETELLVDPEKLARVICGSARVFYSTQYEFTKEFSTCLRYKELSCYNGSIRVYRPGFRDAAGESYRHRLLNSTFIQSEGEDEVIGIFRKAFAQNIAFYDKFFSIEDCQNMKKDAARKRRIAQLHEEHEQKAFDSLAEEEARTRAEEARALEAEDRADTLELENDDLKSKNYDLNQQVEFMRGIVEKYGQMEASTRARLEIAAYPKTPEQIVAYFERMFPDRIAFSDDGKKSLKGCILDAAELWSILFGLATTVCDSYMDENCTNPYAGFYELTRYKVKRGEGSGTHKDSKKMRQFITTYEGKEIDIEPHVTISQKSQSVHFGFDAESSKVIVGHCGEHLTIALSRKHK